MSLDREVEKRIANDEVAKVILSYPGAGKVSLQHSSLKHGD